MTKKFKTVVLVLFIVTSFLTWLGFHLYNEFYVSTDDAYINANVVQIAPRVVGKIMHIYVNNNQYVKAGQLLFDIDKAPFQASVDSASAQVAISEAQLTKATLVAKRITSLVKQKFLSQQDNDNAITALKTATSRLQFAKAVLAQALLNLQYTKVTAPTSGWVTNFTLRAGDVVSANQPLFALISDEEFWVDANFKETQVGYIKPGFKATITTDLYPDYKFNGIVTSISNVTGTAFSLLPPQNATGNWVKVTQRIPVRIHIINPDQRHQLRVGISANVSIHRHS